jgi:hypothetical protein
MSNEPTDTFAALQATRRAFLKDIQSHNTCDPTGRACREPHQCGCQLELEILVKNEQQ